MNVALVYILPHIRLDRYRPLARRFVDSYQRFPAGEEHRLFVVVNGAIPDRIHQEPFANLGAEFLHHTNVGKDIGAYQMFAERFSDQFDLMLCLGTPVHFRRALWLSRILEAYAQHGPGLYGSYGFHQPNLHIRTTNFWLPPHLLNSYPLSISDATRYEFEHGSKSITRHVLGLGYPVMQVSWTRCVPHTGWMDHFVEMMSNEEALILDQHTDSKGYR